MTKTNNGLVWWLSVLAGLQSLSAAAAVTDTLGPRGGGLFAAVIAALSVGTAAYVAAAKPVESQPAEPPRTR